MKEGLREVAGLSPAQLTENRKIPTGKRSLGKMTPIEYEVAHEAIDKELLVA